MSLSQKRIEELKRAEAKLLALEAGGVDNWDGYDISLEDFRKEEELNERLSELLGELEIIFGEAAYEPSERGAGIAFTDDVFNEAKNLLLKSKVTFSDLGE